MKKFLVLATVVILLTGCSSSGSNLAPGKVVGCQDINIVSSTAPPLDCLAGGAGISVDAIRGPALINVWGTWCYPCRQELPLLGEFMSKHGDQVQLIGIAVEEKSQASVRKFVRSHGITWPILYDAKGTTRGLFGMGVPVTWFIDSTGTVVHKQIGPFKSVADIEKDAKKYLGIR